MKFFFDRVGPNLTDRDDLGSSFNDLEAAYLDGYEAALEVSVEMLRRRENPIGGRLEIRDEQRRLLIDIPFAEVLRADVRVDRHVDDRAIKNLRVSVARSQKLRADLTIALLTAKSSIEAARATLDRSQLRGA